MRSNECQPLSIPSLHKTENEDSPTRDQNLERSINHCGIWVATEDLKKFAANDWGDLHLPLPSSAVTIRQLTCVLH